MSKLEPGNSVRFETDAQVEIGQDLRWVNQIAYADSDVREHSLAVLPCSETRPNQRQERQTTRVKWVTNFTVKAIIVVTVANQGGRLSWRIDKRTEERWIPVRAPPQ